jgi:aspartyl-tRNA synthetase
LRHAVSRSDVDYVVNTSFESFFLRESRLRLHARSFGCGAPPHRGIALGFDRLIAILCGTPSIRDVIAFPKTAKATDLMTESPVPVEPKQLRDLHIDLRVPKRDHAPEVPPTDERKFVV